MKATCIRWAGYLWLLFVLAFFDLNFEFRPFFDIPSVMIVFGGVLGVLLAGMDKDFLPALRVWNLRGSADAANVALLGKLCGLGFSAAWILGFFGVVTGMCMILAGGVEDRKAMQAGTGVALLTLVYGSLLALFFQIHRVRVRRWLAKQGK